MRRRTGNAGLKLITALVMVVAISAALFVVLNKDRAGEKGSGLGEEFQYDLEPFKKIDPDLILYEEAGAKIDTGFKVARAIAVGPDDRIYVAGDRNVRVFDSEGGGLAWEFGKSSLEDTPSCLAVAESGVVYAGVRHHVEVFDSKGARLEQWEKAGPKALLISIAVTGDHVFTADFTGREVLHYTKGGKLENPIGDFVVPSPYFDLAVAPDQTLQVVNPGEHRIETYTFEGDLMIWWGEFSNTAIEGFSGCCNPVNFALLPDGQGYVTSEKGLTRVKVYDSGGDFVGVVAGPEKFVEHDRRTSATDVGPSLIGLDVAVDSRGRVLVLDPALSEVRIFTRKQQEDKPE